MSQTTIISHRLYFVFSILSFSQYMAVLYADEKEKYDPSAFRDSIVQGLTEAQGDIEQV